MECPHCHGPFNDPTTFPCGHSCCLEEAMKLPHCCVCESRFNHKQLRVNYFMRDILTKLHTKRSDESSDKELLPLLECPICFIPYIDPTTFPCGHSVCLEEAKELRSCPICNGWVPENLSLNVSMRALISHLCSYSADKELSLQVTSLTLDTQEVLEEVKDCIEAVEDEGAVYVTEAMKKKRKSKKKKPKVTIELLADLYYDAKFKIDFKAMERIEQIAASDHMLATGFCGILYTEPAYYERVNPLGDSQSMSKKVLPWLLATHAGTNDKILQYLIGMLNYALLQHIAGLQYLKLSANQGYGAAQYSLGIVLNAIHDDHSKSVVWLKKASEQGIVMASRKLGFFYQGNIQPSPSQSLKYFKLAADQGDVESQFTMGTIYHFGKGVMADQAKAISYFKLAADQGLPVAQYNVGTAYMTGDGVLMDKVKAIHYFTLAADQGDLRAQSSLASCLLNGKGTPRNEALGIKYLKLCADQIHTEDSAQIHSNACGILGCYYVHKKDYIAAAKYLKIGADGGFTDAQYYFAMMLQEGKWVAIDEALSFHYCKLAADKGKDLAQMEVALAYQKGSVVPKCLNETFRYAKMAADQGLIEAYRNIGEGFLSGKDIEKDAQEGVRYLKLASDLGDADAQYQLGKCYFKGEGVEESKTMSFKYFKTSADNKNETALFLIGRLYMSGIGTAKDTLKGLKYMRMAADQGSPDAIDFFTNEL